MLNVRVHLHKLGSSVSLVAYYNSSQVGAARNPQVAVMKAVNDWAIIKNSFNPHLRKGNINMQWGYINVHLVDDIYFLI